MSSLKKALIVLPAAVAGGWALLSVVVVEGILGGHSAALGRVRGPLYVLCGLGLTTTLLGAWWIAGRMRSVLQALLDGASSADAPHIDEELLDPELTGLAERIEALKEEARAVADLRAHLATITAKAARIADGDLTVSADGVPPSPALSALDRSLSRVAEDMMNQLGGLKELSTALQESALQMTASTAQLASSANEQAAAISQATSTAEEIKQTGLTARDNAHRIVEVAETSVEVSAEGRQAATDSVAAMGRVQERVESITTDIESLRAQVGEVGEIIATVAGISEQSNLLAVNASIEAAKAGEFGRGFAVVAHEVKNLADQSKRATVQVRRTLGKIQSAIGAVVETARTGRLASEEGVKTIEHTGEVISRLASTIADTADAAQAIAIGANEQVVGMEQMTQAMTSINQAANENLKVTAEVETTGRGFAAMAGEVGTVVARYRVSA